MRSVVSICCAMLLAVCASAPAQDSELSENDWPWWRGPGRDGIATGPLPPLKWDATENILWKTAVPGRSHGSVIVVGDQVLLVAADPVREQQAVICLNRDSGQLQWKTVVHQGGFTDGGNQKATLGSTSPACDGKRIFVNFLNDGAVYTTALSREGEQLWQTKISDYVVHQGYGSSPTVWESLVIVSADNKGGGAIAGLDRESGAIVWMRDRPAKPNYASPVILQAGGTHQLIFTGCDLVTSLDPLSGKVNWEVEGATTECVTTTVTDGQHIFTSGGYPKNHISAVAADGSGTVVWENKTRTYVPSMITAGGYLYAVLDAGVAVCYDSSTGKEIWKGRLAGTFSSSPVLIGDRIYATNEGGTTFVFRATPEKFEKLATNQLGDIVFATPTIVGGRIYQRVAHGVGDERQEFIYCIGRE